MANTFDGYHPSFENISLHYVLAKIIKFRKQLTVRSDIKSQSGWDDSLNSYMIAQLQAIAHTVKRITYNPSPDSREVLEAEAADTTKDLYDVFDEKSAATDDILMPSGPAREVTWDLAGGDIDIPQLDEHNCPNDILRGFITGLDDLFVQATRLDSRFLRDYVTKNDGKILQSYIDRLFTICQVDGGEANRSDIATGTLPSQEPGTVAP